MLYTLMLTQLPNEVLRLVFDVGVCNRFFFYHAFHRLSPPTFVWIIDNITIKATITKETAAAYPKLGVNL